jgi:uncharacterized Zn finger protein
MYEHGYEPGRLRRAAQLAVKRLGPMQFRVRGQDEPFYDVNLEIDTPCTCMDAYHHGRGCKHELAARLQNGDLALIQALGDMLLKAHKANEALNRKRRRKSA